MMEAILALLRWGMFLPSAALALGGCDDPPKIKDEADAQAGSPSGSAETAAASIIRPEVAPEPAEVPLQPLKATVPLAGAGYKLDPPAEQALAEVLASEQLAAGWPIVLRGHSDSVGNDEANLHASRRRAETVADWLVDRGVERERITIIALGEQRPIAPNAKLDGTPDEGGRARNRRATITISPPKPRSNGDQRIGDNRAVGD